MFIIFGIRFFFPNYLNVRWVNSFLSFNVFLVSNGLMVRINLPFPDLVEGRVLHTAALNMFSSCSLHNGRGKAALFYNCLWFVWGYFEVLCSTHCCTNLQAHTNSTDFNLRAKHLTTGQ